MHYQLFFPGKTSNAASCLRSVGLADFVDGANEMPLTGRDNAPLGLLVTWGDIPRWEPSNQAVTDCKGYKLVMWLGEDRRCTPADLARQSLFPYYRIPLSDKQEWDVPRASELPSGLRMVDGQWTKVRKPQFMDFWNQSETWFRVPRPFIWMKSVGEKMGRKRPMLRISGQSYPVVIMPTVTQTRALLVL